MLIGYNGANACNQVTLWCALIELWVNLKLFSKLFLVFIVVSTMGLIR